MKAPVQLSLWSLWEALVPAAPEPVSAPPPSAALPPPEAARPSRPAAPPSAAGVPATPGRSQRLLLVGTHRIEYTLRRARRRTIGFLVGPEGVVVSAPRWVGAGEIESALREKAPWVLKKLAEQRERLARIEAARIEWRDGSTIPFLGQEVVVLLDVRVAAAELRETSGILPGVARRVLHLPLAHDAAPAQIRDAVQSWLQRQAKRIFAERVAHFAPRLRVTVTRLALSAAATRWGSASANGSVRLNWRLVHFALPVIDYVVAHELAHLREMNHSPAFWRVVGSAVPDYESARTRLKREVLPGFD